MEGIAGAGAPVEEAGWIEVARLRYRREKCQIIAAGVFS